MSWRTEWAALSNRIRGLLEAGHLVLYSTRDNSQVNLVAFEKIIKPHSEVIRRSIEDFLELFKSNISTQATKCIEDFAAMYDRQLSNRNWFEISTMQTALALLASFRSELNYHLADIQAVSRRLTERAFIHLQSSIFADTRIKNSWEEAFEKGETHCERLGAAHLLSHGIWSFKASAEGGRTDLILGEPITDLTKVESTAEALVLTEWKVVRDPKKELKRKAEEALGQAKRYACGVLAGFELAGYRYLVIVSNDAIDLPPDVFEDPISYKYWNIAVNPSTPSKDARRAKGKTDL